MSSKTLITGYINPDLDAYACALAYTELLLSQENVVVAASYGQPLAEVQFLMDLLSVQPLPTPDPTHFDKFIIVDTNRPSRIDNRIDTSKVIEVVDHHSGANPADFPNAILNIEMVGAAATLIAEKFQSANLIPSHTTAAFILAAQISNTLNFQAAVVTPRDIAIADWLKPLAQLPGNFVKQLYQAKSDTTGIKLARQILDDLSITEPIHNQTIGIGQLELVGSAELLSSRMPDILEILASIQTQQETNYIFLSIIDVELGKTLFVTDHQLTKELLKDAFAIPFNGSIAEYPQLILRKQYFSKLLGIL